MLSGITLPPRYSINPTDLALLQAKLRRNSSLCLTVIDHSFQLQPHITEDDPVKIYDLNGESAMQMAGVVSLSDFVGFDDDDEEDEDALADVAEEVNRFIIWMLINPSQTDPLLLKIKMGSGDVNMITGIHECGFNGDECRIEVV